jgi:SP family myo-inositol transporter-like MFS transporter 13
MNFLMTMVGMMLVDRKGRKFLFILGTSGIIVSLVAVGTLFLRTEKVSVDARDVVQQMVGPGQQLTLHFDQAEAAKLLAAAGDGGGADRWRSRFAGHYLFVRRLHGGDQLCALRRSCRGCPIEDHARELRSFQQDRGCFKNPFANLAPRRPRR